MCLSRLWFPQEKWMWLLPSNVAPTKFWAIQYSEWQSTFQYTMSFVIVRKNKGEKSGKEVYNPGLHSKLLVIFVLQTCGTQQTWVYWHSDITTLDYLWVWCLSAYATHTYYTLAQYRSEFLFPFLTNSQVTETNTFWQKKKSCTLHLLSTNCLAGKHWILNIF
jgi:hypothetical protein